MLLAIDAGNTNITFGIRKKKEWVRLWRIPSKNTPSPDLWSYRMLSELLELGSRPADVRQAVISSVVPSLTEPLREMAENIFGYKPIVVDSRIYSQLNIRISNPSEMGTDLVANAVAAYQLYQQPCIVVDFGTALTFTTVGDNGEILGVAIAPGLKTAVYSLVKNTAQLPHVPLLVPNSALGKDTIQAIQAGVLLGYTGMVKYLLAFIKAELGQPVKIIATGGLSSILTSLEDSFDDIDKKLTINGLAIIADQVG